MGEKFTSNPARGTGALSIPLPVSPGRSGFQPQLELTYDSAAGDGPFGRGWDVPLPSVSRRTDNGLPRYDDPAESDIFVLAGAEDLVPAVQRGPDGELVSGADGSPVPDQFERDGHRVKRYRPRTEGLFSRIERWTRVADPADVHWRTVSRDNVTTLYGRDLNSRIADPDDNSRIAHWLICHSHDDRGNAIDYRYEAEDAAGLDLSAASEGHRRDRPSTANRYIKSIRYGNRASLLHPDPPAAWRDQWLFEVVFDYDEGHCTELPPRDGVPADDQHARVVATASPTRPWGIRPDPFSSYRFGFEVRTYRRCRRVLLFHHIPELGDLPFLVTSTDLDHADLGDGASLPDQLAHQGSTRFGSFLAAVTQHGYAADPDSAPGSGTYIRMSRPELTLRYTRPVLDHDVHVVAAGDLENLPMGLAEPLQWVDLDAEGVAGALLEQGGAWWYKRNEGNGRFAPLEMVAELPTGGFAQRRRLLDLDGDGPLDLVALAGSVPGFHERTAGGGWSAHRTFRSLPRIDWDDPALRFVDLDGDGRADVLVTEPDRVSWYPSLGEDGFGPARTVPWPAGADPAPRMLFSDGARAVYAADMSGDGLADLVRIENGGVSYQPNLGYGRFGPAVVMDDPPWFDHPDQFDQRRLRLVDVDGSGVTDIVYLGGDVARAYLNRTGNGWSPALELTGFPPADSVATVTAVDLLGTGTACLVWSSPLPADAAAPLRYLDLMGGTKPHLLTEIHNNLGAETVIRYASSTQFFLADRQAGTRWATRLPFPVHVVERVVTMDRIREKRHVTRYTYHHGHYDGVEREFRGFGRVDQWDTEEPAPEPAPTDLPPVLTRTWFHTGAFVDVDRVSTQMAAEYYAAPGSGALLLDDTILPAELDTVDRREACRALRGTLLRQEVYARDGSSRQDLPYRVTEQNMTVRRVQPREDRRHAVFLPHPRESITCHHERRDDDPRVVHDLTLEVNGFGQVTRSAQIAYGRQLADTDLPPATQQAQATTLATCTEEALTGIVDDSDDHRLPLPAQTSVFELTGLPATVPLTFRQVADAVVDAAVIAPEDTPDPGLLQRRLADRQRTLYRKGDLTGPCDLGRHEKQGLVYETYRLAFTPGLLARTFRRRGTDLLPDPAAVLPTDESAGSASDRGGYVDLDGDGGWWIPSGRVLLGPAAAELDHARWHFFLPHRYLDPFDLSGARAETVVEYDAHDLVVVRTVDPLDNKTVADIDHRVLLPRRLTDANGAHTEVAYDALGTVIATAVRARDDDVPVRGDSLTGVTPDLTRGQTRAAFATPGSGPHDLLGSATTRLVYDLFGWAEGRGPVGVRTIARETHTSEAPGQTSGLQHGFAYSDGLGREIQQKRQAEPGPGGGPRWVGSGWVEYNNKGNPVRQFEPFFSDTHQPELSAAHGVARTLVYDPIERVVAVLHPDETFEKVVFDAWSRSDHDVNDTVTGDPRTDPDVGGFAGRLLPSGAGWQTWYEQRSDGGRGEDERDAAAKAAAHAGTPAAEHLDPLGRTVLSRAHNGFDATGQPVHLDTRWVLDVEGDPRAVIDAAGRAVMRYGYDLAGNRTHSASMEAGERWTLPDAAGNPVRAWDARGHDIRTEYDVLRRPARRFVHGTDAVRSEPDTRAGELLVEQIDYGEGEQDAAARYLRTKVLRRRDGAGAVTSSYDFRGNVSGLVREVSPTYDATLDWAKPQPLGERFASSTRYDALNRPIQFVSPHLTAPADSARHVVQHVYNEAGLLERIDVWLGRDADPPDLVDAATEAPSAVGVAAIAYDERGRRTEVLRPNGVSTSYRYDDATFRLVQLRTHRAAPLSDDVQDLRYTYDPAGNITRIRDGAQQDVFFRNRRVDPDRDHTYDPVYRIVQATGREHLSQGLRVPHSYDDVARIGLPHPGDGDAMGRYCETYDYDAVGNVLTMSHREACPGAQSWARTFTYAEPSQLDPAEVGNRLTSTTVGNTTEVYSTGGDGYDAHGNMLRMPQLQELRWDHGDHLRMTRRQAVDADDAAGLQRTGERTFYVYDATGARVRKVTETAAGALKEERLYLDGVEIYRRHTGAEAGLERETLHVLDGEQRIALVETRNGVDDGSPVRMIRYQHGDHLGSVNLELDENAEVVTYEEYTPYGSTSYQAVRREIQAPRKRYRFTGKERDEESGLCYHGARYYAPWLARWTACDPLALKDSTNSYVYAIANPALYVDGAGTDVKKVVRSDNYREVLREALGDVQRRSMTDDAFAKEAPRYLKSFETQKWLPGTERAVQRAFQDRVRLFGRTTTKLEGFTPPGWGAGDTDACFRLAFQGANQTAAAGEDARSGGGVLLYEAVKQRIVTDKDASALALAQVRRHIDSGRALLAGVNEPANSTVVNAAKQPVTDHFVAIYGYETNTQGDITALLAKDNAVGATAEVRFTVKPSGEIVKPAEPKRAEEYLRQEYQLSEVRFHTGFEYVGPLRPTNDAGRSSFWPVPPPK